VLKDGDEIEFTESALSIERLVGKFVNNSGIEPGADKADNGGKAEKAAAEEKQK
jgi:hypothetical protein